ncbi:MAG: hypothetical protein ACRDRI_15855 [Pseudonocardiaceae bacterium]
MAANLDQRAAERSYGITEDQLTPAVSWSVFGLRRAWNAVKAQRAPWWAEVGGGGRRTRRRPTPAGSPTWPPPCPIGLPRSPVNALAGRWRFPGSRTAAPA